MIFLANCLTGLFDRISRILSNSLLRVETLRLTTMRIYRGHALLSASHDATINLKAVLECRVITPTPEAE